MTEVTAVMYEQMALAVQEMIISCIVQILPPILSYLGVWYSVKLGIHLFKNLLDDYGPWANSDWSEFHEDAIFGSGAHVDSWVNDDFIDDGDYDYYNELANEYDI